MVVMIGYSVDSMQELRGRCRRLIWTAGQITLKETVSLSTE